MYLKCQSLLSITLPSFHFVVILLSFSPLLLPQIFQWIYRFHIVTFTSRKTYARKSFCTHGWVLAFGHMQSSFLPAFFLLEVEGCFLFKGTKYSWTGTSLEWEIGRSVSLDLLRSVGLNRLPKILEKVQVHKVSQSFYIVHWPANK